MKIWNIKEDFSHTRVVRSFVRCTANAQDDKYADRASNRINVLVLVQWASALRFARLASLMITIFILALPFLSFAQSSEAHYPTKTTIQILEQPFQTERVSENDLQQFEAKALQKLQDFDDYMKIAADKMYDKEMREYAVELALTPFHTDSAFFFVQNSKMNISELLRNSLNENELKYTFRNYSLSQKFNRLPGEEKYTGKVIGDLVFLTNSSFSSFEMPIYLIKTPKAFGKETREVWEVFLGDINCQ